MEAPHRFGGVLGGKEVANLVAAASPLYVKFALRNSRRLCASGMHLENDAIVIAREKVRRAQVSMEWLHRSDIPLIQSKSGALGLGNPKL
jgi:hypothetical protein